MELISKELLNSLKLKLEQALKLAHPYPFRVLEAGTPAAVLALLTYSRETALPEILITRRTDRVETHKGQYALPGGVMDPEDQAQGGLAKTALRETEEEVGIAQTQIEILGALPRLWTPSGFLITSQVGVARVWREHLHLKPNPEEIDEAFWVSLSKLQEAGVYRQEMHRIGSVSVPTDVFQVDHHRIWGATGAVLKNLIGRLEQVD